MQMAALLLLSLLGAALPPLSRPLPAAAQAAIPLDTPFTLATGASARVGPDGLRVTFDRVVSDSRCPRDVRCIHTGEAVLGVTVSDAGRREPLQLSTARGGESATWGAHRVSLLRVEPVPESTRPTDPSAYRATFSVGRASP